MGSTASHPQPPASSASEGTHLYVPSEQIAPPDDATVISRPNAGDLAPALVPAPPHEHSKLLAGEKLGPYELLEFAGGGGMGAVFRARDSLLNREVAIKVLARDQATDEETLKRFKNEAQSAARLDHENIARVYFVGEDRGLNFIVFEYIEGLNVRQLVDKQGPLRLEDAVSYVLQIADALAHATARDVVHRDIKPSNILITAQGKAKLVDMGLARLHGMQPGGDLTASGVTLGTFDYISPEQARDPRSADVRSDIYSLGCTFYFMLTGRPPFPEGTVLQKLLQHNSDDPIDPREYNPNLPESVTTVLRKMLAKDPQRRYQTPGELIADLLHLGDQVGLGRAEVRLTTNWETATAEPSFWSRQLPWLVPTAALAIVVAALELFDRRVESRWQAISSESPSSERPVGGGRKSPRPTSTGAAPTAEAAAAAASNSPRQPTRVLADDENASPTSDGSPAPTGATVAMTSEPRRGTENADAVRSLPEPREGVLVVCDQADAAGRFTSLRAACVAAKNGDVVELCYDGVRVERPLALNNLKITVRAGEGYSPVVAFRPAETALPDMPQAMITLAGGRLTLVGVHVDFAAPSAQEIPADHWTLFELQAQEHLEINRCVLTVRNADADGRTYHPNVAVIGTKVPPGSAAMMNMPGGEPTVARQPTEVGLEHVVVRGEAALLRNTDLQPLTLTCQNAFLALRDALLVVQGGQMPPRDSEVRLVLRHVTSIGAADAIRVAAGFDVPFLPAVNVACYDTILATTSGAALLSYEGVDSQADFLNFFNWSAEHVFFEGFRADQFWRIASPAAEQQWLSFDDWRAQWGAQRDVQSEWGGIRWSRGLGAAGSVSFHRLRAEEFSLDDGEPRQKAVRGAADGTDVGMDVAALPVPIPDSGKGPGASRPPTTVSNRRS